jgi:hypothetical protein
MTSERLEFYLNRGNLFGYNTQNDNDIIGWIILRKRSPNVGFFERFDKADAPNFYQDQLKIKNEPYSIWIAQITRKAFESDKLPIEENYLLNVNYTFSTLDDAGRFVKEIGYDLSEMKWAADVDFL